jgi:hypothetical protein
MQDKPSLGECIQHTEKVIEELALDAMEALEQQREIEFGYCRGCGTPFINHPSFLDQNIYCLECVS